MVGRFLIEVRVRGLPWWGVYEGYGNQESAKRVARRLREKGWYKAVRVVDTLDNGDALDVIDAFGTPCGAVRRVGLDPSPGRPPGGYFFWLLNNVGE